MANPQLIADAEAEKLATRLKLKPNPWAGAGGRLETAEAARLAEAQRIEHENAERAEALRANDFAQAIAGVESLRKDLADADIRAAALERAFAAPEMVRAGQNFDAFQRWRQNGAVARDAEMVYRSTGVYPSDHFLARGSPNELVKMREYEALLKRRQREERLQAAALDALLDLQARWPALRSLPVGELVS